MTAVLEASGLTKTYGSTVALADVDLTIDAGESVAIMGASGSGKTTLLHCLAGIVIPDDGSVRLTTPVGPVIVNELGDTQRSALRRSTFGFVFQQGLLIPELTAVENAAIPLMLGGMPRAAAEQHAGAWLAALGLADRLGSRIGELSGGQAQRVAIARAQVAAPAVVFADEPTGALDSHTAADVIDALIGSTTAAGRTLIVVTHDEDVAAHCGRIVRLRDGRIIETRTRVGATGEMQLIETLPTGTAGRRSASSGTGGVAPPTGTAGRRSASSGTGGVAPPTGTAGRRSASSGTGGVAPPTGTAGRRSASSGTGGVAPPTGTAGRRSASSGTGGVAPPTGTAGRRSASSGTGGVGPGADE